MLILMFINIAGMINQQSVRQMHINRFCKRGTTVDIGR